MRNSFELLKYLKPNYKANTKDPKWWPNSGSFEVVVGAILTQQTKWENVEKSLNNLKNDNLLNIHSIGKLPREDLAIYIKPSGFYNTKAKNLQILCKNILNEFFDFETFKEEVSKDWLLKQKGIGQESADSILCYALGRDVMVVDSYTHRLVKEIGFDFEMYEDLQDWCQNGILEDYDEVLNLYNDKITLNEIYSRFHGKIVMFCKENYKGKKLKKAGSLPC